MAQKPIGFYGKFTPTSIDSTVGDRFKALAGLSSDVGQLAVGIGKAKAAAAAPEQALAAIAKAEEEGTELAKRSAFAWGSQTYNNTMSAAYASSADADYRMGISKIAAENPTDLAAFNELAREYTKGVSSNLQPAFAGVLQVSMDSVLSSAQMTIQSNEIKKNTANADLVLVSGIDTATESAMTQAKMGQPVEASASKDAAFSNIDARVGSTAITFEQGAAAKKAITVEIESASARGALQSIITTTGPMEAAAWIQKISETPIKGFEIGQQDALVDSLRSDLSQHLSLQDVQSAANTKALATKHKQNAANLLSGILLGSVDEAALILASSKSDIGFSQFSTLTTALANRGQGTDDFLTIATINDLMISDPAQAETLIMENVNTLITGNTATSLLAAARESQNSESILQRSDVKRYRNHIKDQIVVTGPAGAFLPDKLVKQSNLLLAYDSKILNMVKSGETVEEIMQDLMEIVPLVRGKQYNVENQKAILEEQLKLGEGNGGISESEYNDQFYKLEANDKIRENYLEFVDSLTKGNK
jgi:hypothetical protein